MTMIARNLILRKCLILEQAKIVDYSINNREHRSVEADTSYIPKNRLYKVLVTYSKIELIEVINVLLSVNDIKNHFLLTDKTMKRVSIIS